MMVALEFGVVGGAGEGDYVADVGHSGDEEHQTLEAQSESRVRHGAVTAGVGITPQVPPWGGPRGAGPPWRAPR